jgi:hypothetical protein
MQAMHRSLRLNQWYETAEANLNGIALGAAGKDPGGSGLPGISITPLSELRLASSHV